MNILDIVINTSESYLYRILRNPIRIINKSDNTYIHNFFTNCIDEPLNELRFNGRLNSYNKKYGAIFKFFDKNGDIISQENEDNYCLNQIIHHSNENYWKEIYISNDAN